MDKSEVINLAADVAKLIGIRMISPDLIRKQMNDVFPTATILHTQDYTLWIDAHYIAVDWTGLHGVLYIYISRRHVAEELWDVIKLRERSENLADYRLYDNIANQLISAQKHMAATGTDYYLNEHYLESIQKKGHPNMDNKTTTKERPQILTLTLCHKCKTDFENSGYIAIHKGWQENKERCDYCTVGMGVTYGVFNRGMEGRHGNQHTGDVPHHF